MPPSFAHDARTRATQAGPTTIWCWPRATPDRYPPGSGAADGPRHRAPARPKLAVLRPSQLYLPARWPSRYLLPDSASDEAHLVSMCDDPAYVYALTVYTLLSDDLFNSKWRFVELILDGRTRGITSWMEKTREELVRDFARVSGVMRRRYPVGTNEGFEVLYSINDDLVAPATRYQDFMTKIAPLSGAPLISALREQLDYDQYLRYLANQSVLQSGDYIDELYHWQRTGQWNGRHYRDLSLGMAWDPRAIPPATPAGPTPMSTPTAWPMVPSPVWTSRSCPMRWSARLRHQAVKSCCQSADPTRMANCVSIARTALQAG